MTSIPGPVLGDLALQLREQVRRDPLQTATRSQQVLHEFSASVPRITGQPNGEIDMQILAHLTPARRVEHDGDGRVAALRT